jgi:hypothetical protein
MLVEEGEDSGSTVVRGRVVGAARETIVCGVIGNLVRDRLLGHLPKFGEPTGCHRAQCTIFRKTQKRIPFAELTVLISSSYDINVFEVEVAKRARDHIELMINVKDQQGAVAPAGLRGRLKVSRDVRTLEKDRGRVDCGGAITG